MPASIIPTNPALQEYEVDFTPPGSGMYTIRVFFAGMEVPSKYLCLLDVFSLIGLVNIYSFSQRGKPYI